MKEKKQIITPNNLFGKENYIWILAGIVIMAIGILLMTGGKSDDPNVFNYNEVYSKRRITVAPVLILLGLAIEVYAIFKKPKS